MLLCLVCATAAESIHISNTQIITYGQVAGNKTEIFIDSPRISIMVSPVSRINASVYKKEGNYKYMTKMDSDDFGYYFGNQTGKIVVNSEKDVNVTIYTLLMNSNIDYYISLSPESVFEISNDYQRNVSINVNMNICYWSPSIASNKVTVSFNLEKDALYTYFMDQTVQKREGRGFKAFDTNKPYMFCLSPNKPKRNMFVYIKSESKISKDKYFFVSAVRPSNEPQVIRNEEIQNTQLKEVSMVEFSIIIFVIVIINFVILIIIKFYLTNKNDTESNLIDYNDENLNIESDNNDIVI